MTLKSDIKQITIEHVMAVYAAEQQILNARIAELERLLALAQAQNEIGEQVLKASGEQRRTAEARVVKLESALRAITIAKVPMELGWVTGAASAALSGKETP